MEQKIKINGADVNYYDNGLVNQPVICLLHGWGQNWHCFEPLINAIKNTYRVIAIDLPGFGLSDEPLSPYSIYDYYDVVSKLLTDIGVDEVILVGHSFGGRVSIIFANREPQRVSKMILTGAAGIKPKKTFGQKLSIWHYKFMKLLTKTPIFSQFHQDLIKNSGSSDYKQASSMMKQVLIKTVNEDLTPLLSQVDQPTLLYWGDDDDQTPLSDGYKMERYFGNATLVHVANHGHFAFMTNSADFIKHVLKFLET